jgi:hypothetical protein
MTEPQDPPRLLDDERSPERLRALVHASHDDIGTTEDVKRLESRLLPLIWPAVPPPTPGPSGTAGTTSAATGASAAVVKAGAAVGVVLALAGGVVWVSKSTSGVDAGHAAPSAAPRRSNAPASEEVRPSTTDTSDLAGAAEPSAPGDSPRASPPVTSKDRTPSQSASISEADLLGRAQASLRTDPARALSLADEHRREFPNGVLSQEREVLSIEALERLGKHQDAVARADRFMRSYPGSAHRSKVNAVVGRE